MHSFTALFSTAGNISNIAMRISISLIVTYVMPNQFVAIADLLATVKVSTNYH